MGSRCRNSYRHALHLVPGAVSGSQYGLELAVLVIFWLFSCALLIVYGQHVMGFFMVNRVGTIDMVQFSTC